ncbi:ACT domain-containing protein [Alteromonas sp. H39]|uniref:ACT domain-containing protein n=1 Tax=Alteromonas sp. H39 TaxID=3389876 RepID=UPI0039E139D7
MSGEVVLATLLQNLMPVLSDETYVFVTTTEPDQTALLDPRVKGMFREKEGITLIVEVDYAKEHALDYEGTFRCITCEVHSSLDAVGMTSAMTAALTHFGISANVVAAYYHDHIFVPERRAEEAVSALASLQAEIVE